MVPKFILFILVLVFFGVNTSNAQIRGFLRDKIKEAIIEESESKSDKEKADDQNTGKNDYSSPPSPFQKKMEERIKLAVGIADLDFEDQYNFNSSMSMDVESFDGESEDKSEMNYTLFYNEDESSFAMQFSGNNESTGEQGQHLMIFDMNNHVMLMLSESEDEKSGVAFKFDPDPQTAGQENEGVNQDNEATNEKYDVWIPEFRKTGKTKKISGYSCDEYSWENDTVKMDFWLSPKAKFDYSQAWGYMGGLQSLTTGNADFNGVIMEYNFLDKPTTAWSKMIVREINPDRPSKFDISGFSVVGFDRPPGDRYQ